jgi:parvulin-like peptidyl-prolyl isomerase
MRSVFLAALAGALAAGAGSAAAQPPTPAKPKPAESKPAEPKPAPKPAAPKPAEPKPADPGTTATPGTQPVPSPVPLPSPGGAAKAAPAPKRRARPGDTLSVDRVVGVVNESVILYSELMRRVAPLTRELEGVTDPAERKRRKDKLKSQVLDEMVNEELIILAAGESKLEVSAKEVQSALEEIKKQNNLDDNQLSEALRLQGYTMASYRHDVRRQILRMRAVNMLVRPRVTVTDDDVRARYDATSRRSTAVKRIKLRHILIGLPEHATEAQLAEAKRRAAAIMEQVRGGADFARVAAAESADESTRYSGGELGWIERGSIDTEWEVIVFAMTKGEVRGPITGPRGLHVFQVTDVERSQQKPFAEVKEQLRNEIYRKEMDRQTRLWLDELREKAHIQVKL